MSRKEEIEEHLKPLIGLKLSAARLTDEKCEFHFGEVRISNGIMTGEYVLHIFCPWRIENDAEIITGQSDRWTWNFETIKPAQRTYERRNSLQYDLFMKFFDEHDREQDLWLNPAISTVVERIEASRYGDTVLRLSGENRLVMFPISSYETEWELYAGNGEMPFYSMGDPNKPHGAAPVTVADFLVRADLRYWNTDDLIGAITDCTEAIRLEPNNSQAYAKRGYYKDNIEFGDDAYLAALEDYAKAVELDPRNFDAYFGRYLIYNWNIEDNHLALAEATRFIELQPDSPEELAQAYQDRAFQNWVLDHDDAALADLNRAIELEPSETRHHRRHEIYVFMGNLPAAIADLDAALTFNTDGVYLHLDRADLKDDLGDIAGAMADYSHAIELSPENALAYNQRAWRYFRDGNYDSALPDADLALKYDQQTWDFFHTRGMIYAATDQIVRAICDFQKALDLEPDDPEEKQKMLDYIAKWVRLASD